MTCVNQSSARRARIACPLCAAALAAPRYFRGNAATIIVTNPNDSGPGSLRQALGELDKGREFLKAGGVFDDDFIDSYIDLKMQEVIRFEHTPHPVEFEMYYSA